MKRVDCFGKEIHVGDTVVWTRHKWGTNYTAEVLDFTPTRVKIKYKTWYGHDTTTVSCSNLIKMSETKKTVKNPNKPGENLKEGDRVMYMYLGHCYWHPHLGTGTIKKVGPRLVTIYTDSQVKWVGRREPKTDKVYVTLDPSRVCKIG